MFKHKFLTAFALFAVLLAACAQPSTPAPQATEAPAAEATEAPAAEPTEAPAEEPTADTSSLPEVAREETVVMAWSISSPIGVTNPWAVTGYTHQEGNAMMWEGLSYFAIFADEELPWLASSMDYNDDFTQLTINVRPEAKWSDGTPVTAADVVYTFEGQMNIETLPYHAAFDQFVESVEATDDLTAVVTFKIPAPRFKFEVLTLKFDTGIPIVPKHVLEAQDDPTAFDGGLDMPHSGPYDLKVWDATQKIYDLNTDWWAVEAGIAEVPAPKRLIFVNIGGQVGQGMDVVAQRVTNNEFDTALDFRQSLIASIIQQNPVVTSHTGDQPPYGYLDWWPNSLWVNTALAPYDDARVRRAISLSIDRDTIDEVVYEGAQVTTIYPFPLYPGLQAFADSPEVKALEEQYEPRKFDLDEAAALMTEAGFTLNGDGLWERDGETVNMTIQGFEGIHSDMAPVLEEMLRRGGFDSSINFGTDAYQNMSDGVPGAYLFGHGASLIDPYAAFELYHSKFAAAIGTTAGNNRFSRYNNPEYDTIVDAMGPLSADDPEFHALAVQAMEIYWRDQIDIPVNQWLHRIAYNQTHWTNWPTTTNLAAGTNGAFWAHTGMLVITGLQPAQ